MKDGFKDITKSMIVAGMYVTTASVMLSCNQQNHTSSSNQSDSLNVSNSKIDTIVIKNVKDEPGLALVGFLKYYLTDDSVKYYFNKIVLPDAYGDPNFDTTICFYGDTTNQRKYLEFLNKKGFLTKEFITIEKRGLDTSNARQLERHQLSKFGPPMEFCYDRVFCGQMYPGNINELEAMHIIEYKNGIDSVALFRIKEVGGTYKLIKRKGKWQLVQKCINI